MRILIVEDEQAHAEAIRRSFQTAGLNAEVLVAGTLKEYREITTARPPDIALLDLNLPDGRAVEVLTSPAEASPFPILIMTSYGNEESAVGAMKSGALDYIVKSPEAFSEMPRIVERALREWRLLQERKQADDALRVLLARYRQLVENANEAIVVAQDGRLKFVNPMACEISGYSEEELASLPFVDLVHPNDREMVVSLYLKRLKGDPLLDRYVFRILTKGGAIKWVEIGTALIEWEDQPATLNLLTDITERKQAEDVLRESEERYKALFDRSLDFVYIHDFDGRFIDANDAVLNRFGYTREEMPSLNFASLLSEDQFPLAFKTVKEIQETGIQKDLAEFRLRHKNGSEVYVETKGSAIFSKGRIVAIQAIARDITERKQAEETLRASEERYRDLVENSQDLIYTHDPEGNLLSVNEALVKLMEYSRESLLHMNLSEFLIPELREQLGAYLKEIQSQGQASGIMRLQTAAGETRYWEYNNTLRTEGVAIPIVRGMAHDVTERRRMEEIIRQSEERYRTIIEEIDEGYYEVDLTGNFTFVNDSMIRGLQYSREELIGMSYRTYIPEEQLEGVYQTFNRVYRTGEIIKWYPVTNIRKDGTPIFLEDSLSCLREKGGRIVGFRGIARDITDRKKAEEKLKETLESLRRAMRTTVQVMVAAVETRDPYTAGHQKRVTELARTLAKELGLDQETIEGIRMAGSIHDLGKISVPAEILSKPTKLTEIEFALIKAHSQYGYEILKDVESPWPLADMVLQHHERMDGSGYPQGLKGEAILIEARILAVADVVESISAHRPYRPGHGIETALKEIEQNAGVLYDREVVAACLKLFREKGFRFE